MRKTLIVAIIWISMPGWAQEKQRICDGILIKAPKMLSFTDTEKELICNEPHPKPWSEIPYWQKELFLKTFLQGRGYYYPQFAQVGNKLLVSTGSQSIVNTVTLTGDILTLDTKRYFQIYAKPLTPDLLNNLEKLVLNDYARAGFPCASLKTRAFPKEGIILITIAPGEQMQFPKVSGPAIDSLLLGIETRYEAFWEQRVYDPMLLELSINRMIGDQLIIAGNFTTHCSDDGHKITLESSFITNKPNLVNFGLGFDTEEYLITELGWKNGRLFPTGSSLESFVHASMRKQSAKLAFNWYYAQHVTRHYLKTVLSFVRQNEKDYDSRTINFKVGPDWYNDLDKASYNVWLAPSMQRIVVVRGDGPHVTQFFALTLMGTFTSHDFEFYAARPRSGYDLIIDITNENKSLGSTIAANSYVLSSTHLWNLFNYEPPIWILGVRTKFAVTSVAEGTGSEEIPTNLKSRLGGAANLRGFRRESIPSAGSLLTAYAGVELRMSNILPYGLQPMVFVDVGKIGNDDLSLMNATLWSPGAGVNWYSVIGVIRGTIAYGQVSGQEPSRWRERGGWQYYLSLGEQF